MAADPSSDTTRLFDPERLRERWSGAAVDPVAQAQATPPALALLQQLEQEARRELGALGPALQLLLDELRALIAGGGAEQGGAAGPLLDQLEDLLEARVRW